MVDSRIERWMAKLDASCARLKVDTINVLIDQTGCGLSLKASLKTFQPPLAWCSLFDGLPEEVLEDEAPLLIALSLSRPMERQWLKELMAEFAPQGRILLLCSAWPFMYLASHLKQCIDARWGERAGILRFYDPRLFPVLVNQVLDRSQQLSLHQPALLWSWQDRDGNDCVLFGNPTPPDNSKATSFEFTDEQIDRLITASDAMLLTRYVEGIQRYNLSEEQLFTHCYNGLLDATASGLIVEEERRAHVIKQLCEWRIPK